MGFWRYDEGDVTWVARDEDELKHWVCERIARFHLAEEYVIAFANQKYKPWTLAEMVRKNPEKYPEQLYDELAESIFDTQFPYPKVGEDFDNPYMPFKWECGNPDDL